MASGTIKSVVPRSDIVDNLTTNDSTKVLSAAQGKALNDNLANLDKNVKRETADWIKVGSTRVGWVMKIGRLCIASFEVLNVTIPETGATVPEKYKADWKYYSMCRYYDGTSDKVGSLSIEENGTTFFLRNMADQITSGKYVGGTLVYFASSTEY